MDRYRCTECGQPKERSDLTVKRVQFRGMGAHGQVLVTRVVAWLCRECMNKDSDYNQAPHDTPSRQRA